MRCSSCEPLLDRYIDGALTARQTASVAAHLRTCSDCIALREDYKVVDGLLETVKQQPLPENFTFAVMAHARTMPTPRQRRVSATALLAFYVVAAWVAVFWIYAAGGWRGALTGASSVFTRFAHPLGNALGALVHGYGSTVPFAAQLAAAILTVDAIALAGVFFLYRTLWPRLATQRARATERP